jgi:alkanesulfonate monooxygenase SsuD/methylene tetrahydromethanopterin reductase-like flavin-dependent oxidoreductase (luciferase family)
VTGPAGRLGAYISPRDHLATAIDLVRRAEMLGYDSAWLTHGLGRDGFLVLAAYAHATERIGLGTGVVPIYPRHPVAMAQEASTLVELSGGRFRLGIGLSHRPSMVDALGLDMGEPLAVMREYVAVLRAALQGQVTFEGRYYRVRWTGAFRAPAPPLLLAALAPPMLELAGELADGVVLWLACPAYVRDVAVPALARGRARAGKALEGFEVAAAVPLAVTEDHVGATRLFREELVRYLSLPYYRTMFRESGFGDAVAAFDRDRGRGGPGRDASAVPAALGDALGAIGDARRARAEVEAYRAAGVTLPVVRPIGPREAVHARGTLEAVAP